MLVDVHQHLWTSQLVEALAGREARPFVRHDHGLTVLHLAGEQPYVIDCAAEAPERRAALVGLDGLDRAYVCLSSPLGIESLPRAQARPLLDAYHAGALSLPSPFGVWGAFALDDPDPDDVEAAIGLGCAGVSCPAAALGSVRGVTALRSVLRRLEDLDAPLFVHPGPAPGSWPRESCLDDPLWWPALTDYVADMQAAWYAFTAVGRREHPRLRVLYAMLAGLGPLQGERLEIRGGPAPAIDPLSFYDCSSYGAHAVGALAGVVGESHIVYGSDRPVVDPGPVRSGLADRFERFAAQGARLLSPRTPDAVVPNGTEWPSPDTGLWTGSPVTLGPDPAIIT
jgi:hypothetical protein